LIIRARKILPVTSPPIDYGAIVIKGSKIITLGKEKVILKKYPAEKVIDLEDRLVMPGLVNAHTHLELSQLKGKIAERREFFDWIIELVETRRRLGTKNLEQALRSSLIELLTSGTTCVGDISSTEAALPMLAKSGLRAAAFLEVLGPEEQKAEQIFRSLKSRLGKLKTLPDRITPGISPHSVYSVSPSLIRMISSYTSEYSLPIQVHLSETQHEKLYINGKPSDLDGYMEHFGWKGIKKEKTKSPLGFLEKSGLNKFTAVHCVHLSGPDIKSMARNGISCVFCPRSNYFLGAGKAPVEDMAQAGVNIAIGTDSLASNIDLDLWEEMRFAYLVSRLPARKLIEMATINGATALGLERITGSLAPGKEADLIAVNTDAAKEKDPYYPLLMETRKEDVSATIVQGKPLHSTDGYISYGF
jgi:cytosine/adenosine deaminase-related metal-dependent hydrolase